MYVCAVTKTRVGLYEKCWKIQPETRCNVLLSSQPDVVVLVIVVVVQFFDTAPLQFDTFTASAQLYVGLCVCARISLHLCAQQVECLLHIHIQLPLYLCRYLYTHIFKFLFVSTHSLLEQMSISIACPHSAPAHWRTDATALILEILKNLQCVKHAQ